MTLSSGGKKIVGFIIVILLLGAVAAYTFFGRDRSEMREFDDYAFTEQGSEMPMEQNEEQQRSEEEIAQIRWEFDGQRWRANQEAPTCPDPITLKAPSDLGKATAILYPGQTRGGDYKPHGGFRFDGSSNEISVKAPMDAYVVQGARYLAEGEIQYTFDFRHPCGLMYRVGHLRELTPAFQGIADRFPEARENASQTVQVEPVFVPAGEEIATAVGIINTKNVFYDLGVYDLRQKNVASQDAGWAAQHQPELAHYAVCWFDYLTPVDEARVRAFPAGDPTSGKQSAYCK